MCEWDDHGGGEEGVGAEADHRSSGRDVDCLLDTGKGGGEMADYRSRLNILYAVWYSESWKGSSSFYKWIPPET